MSTTMSSHLPHSSHKLTPADLRKEVLAKRDLLSREERQTKSDAISKRLLNLDTILSSSSIMLYVNFRSEVNTENLIDELIGLDRVVSVPKTYSDEYRLIAVSITDRQRQLVPGYCNIPEPAVEIITANRVPSDQLDIVVLPGSVFDERGGRLGYGGGYYDRFLSAIPRAIRIGLAFDLQIVEEISLQPHDELLDLVITESRIIQTDRLLLQPAPFSNFL